jgi:hypothetical protein
MRTGLHATGHNRGVTSPLSGIALAKRRQFAATLGLFATLFIAVGAVAATGATSAAIKAFVIIALLIAFVLGMVALGVLRSIRLDLAEQRLDAAIADVVQARGGSMCSCGHDHDPTEMHVVRDDHAQHVNGDACAHDGSGADCSHSCDTCVLAALRPPPAARRPQPGPGRPSPARR